VFNAPSSIFTLSAPQRTGTEPELGFGFESAADAAAAAAVADAADAVPAMEAVQICWRSCARH